MQKLGDRVEYLHFIEEPSEGNILVHIVFITLMIASFNNTSSPVPVLVH